MNSGRDSKKPLTPENVTPYDSTTAKGEQIEAMFDHIAPAYDFMNAAMSLGQHRRWRDTALRMASKAVPAPKRILDLATGTGDVAFTLRRLYPEARICGLDLSEGMLSIARKRQEKEAPTSSHPIEFLKGDCLQLPFEDSEYDLLTIAYGVRNFQDLRRGLKEMYRVLRPGGAVCIIELARPKAYIPLLGYRLYTSIIPMVGRLVAGDSDAYRYLPESIAACPQRDGMTSLLREAGFDEAEWRQLTLGTLCIYIAKKK